NHAYGAGQQVAFSADGGSAVHLIHTDVTSDGKIHYFYRFAADGIHFGSPQELSQKGLGRISLLNPALAIAPGGNYLYISKVDEFYSGGESKSLAIYRIAFDQRFSGVWTKMASSAGIQP